MIKQFGVSLWRRLSSDSGSTKTRLFAAALVLGLVVIAATDGWRTTVAAAIAAGVLLATRVRFAPVAALLLVGLIATVAAGGTAPDHHETSAAHPHRPRAHHHAPSSGHRPSASATQ